MHSITATGRRRRSGAAMLEAAMFVPILLLLLFGMVELAKIGYTYYTVNKILYTLARYVGTQQGVNFCDSSDAAIVAAKNLALTGTTDGSVDALVADLKSDMISIRLERYSTDTGGLLECQCDVVGCDAAAGGMPPGYIVVSIPDGYPITFSVPFMAHIDPILLRPSVRVPFGGT